MKAICLFFSALLSAASWAATPGDGALRAAPANPRYFLFHGKPTVLIGSGEHYGAVLNADFDGAKYLRTLAAAGLNVTRLFTGGAYVEPQGAFNITGNSLAPAPGRFVAPWARSKEPGAADGGTRHDLGAWNPAYFERLKSFVGAASKSGIVVEINLFCPFYEEAQWKLSPFHPDNNVNKLGEFGREDVYTLDRSGKLLAVQEAMTRKFVEELKDFDNVYFEICNEPYFGGVSLDWQHRIAEIIAEAQRGHAIPKLISENIANGSAVVKTPHPAVSIFNFHYTYPPTAIGENYQTKRVIGNNETGFRGTLDEVYRCEAWDFILAGGGLFNHLDYSFAAGHEDGTFAYPPKTPGGGGVEFRRQLGVLRDFIHGFDFTKMGPNNDLLPNGGVTGESSVRLLAEPGRQYAFYLHHSARPKWADKEHLRRGEFTDVLKLKAPAGKYEARWMDPLSGKVLREEPIVHLGGSISLTSPVYATDLAMAMRLAP